MTIMGEKIAFGVKPEWSDCCITNLPVGAEVVKRRFSNRSPAIAVVRDNNILTQHYLGLAPEGLTLLHPVIMHVREIK